MGIVLHRLISTILGLLIALGSMFLIRELIPEEIIRVDPEVWDIFFTVFGLIYAIMIGLLLVDSLTRFSTLSSTIQDELNAVEDIRDFLIYVNENEETKSTIVGTLRKYVDSVVGREWDIMSNFQRGHGRMFQRSKTDSTRLDSDTSEELYDIMWAVENIKIHDASDSIALTAIIGKIGETTSFRTKRIELAQQGLPPTLRFLILFMSFVLATGFLFMAIESVWIHALMIVAINTAMHLLFMVITDLDTPFFGLWNIDRASFERVAQSLDQNRQLKRQVASI